MSLAFTRITPNIWFPNQVEPVYDNSTEETLAIFTDYWALERDRCINGFYLADGQLFIPGRLYYHTVYAKIAAYIEDEKTGKKPRKIITPLFRDLDWLIFNDLEKCQIEGLFYSLVGSRDFGKSIIAASAAAHLYTFFDKSECVISGGESTYIKLATDKIEDILINMHPAFKKQRLTSDWKKEVTAGWKDKSTNLADERSSFSSIKVRNYENGSKTMAANGTRPGFHLIDEIGTLPNLIGCFKDSDGCWWSGDGDKPSCLVMIAGTGGDMEVGAEAAEMFFNPEAYNMLTFVNHWEDNGKIGRFIPATMAKLKYKEPKTLADYLGIHHPDLEQITILVSNEDRALKEWWQPQYEKAIKARNSKTMLKFKAYWPLKPSDSFIVLSSNDFDVEAAKAQEQRLIINELEGDWVDLVHDGEKFTCIPSKYLPIREFPFKSDLEHENHGCIVIYEHPVMNPPYGLYVAGIDPYKQDRSKYSDSLGSIFIFKRMFDIVSQEIQDVLVAEYCGRPNEMSEWNKIVENLIKYYNALALCENEDYGFITHMLINNYGHYMQDQPDILKDMFINSQVNRGKGVHVPPKMIAHLNGLVRQYLNEVYRKNINPETGEVTEFTGVRRIPSLGLIREIIKFNSKSGNYDRIRAFSLALLQAQIMTPFQGKVESGNAEDSRFKSYTERRKIGGDKTSSLLGGSRKTSGKRKKIGSPFK